MTEHASGPLVDPEAVPGWLRTLVWRTAELDAERFGLLRARPPENARRAAVLILLGEGGAAPGGSAPDAAGPDVLLLRRADSLNSHPGQVAFPGGALDAGDLGPVQAALREAQEEVGVLPEGIRPVAMLPELFLAFSGFRVIPVVAHWWSPSPVEPVDSAETAAVARVPVSMLTDPANRFKVRFHSGEAGPAFLAPGMLVWGFTGSLLSGLLDLAGWSVEWNQSDVRSLDEAWFAVESATGGGHG